MALEGVLAGLLLSAVTSTAVDVVSQRTIDPKIRRIGQAYRVFSVLDAASSVANSIRVSAYLDAASIIASEVAIEATTKEAKKLLGEHNHVNFELVQRAESLLIQQDIADETTMGRWKLDPMEFDRGRKAFYKEDWESCGQSLVDLVWPCVRKAAEAAKHSDEITATPDAAELRKRRNWDRQPNWIDKVNTGLGYAIWVPTPVIGVGTGIIYNDNLYTGIYRRDSPEGYGKIRFSNGAVYKGQIHRKDMGGYGVLRQSDGTILGGHFCRSSGVLGALVVPDRSRVIAGSHRVHGGTFGFARQVGLKDDVPSQSGFWRDGTITHPITTNADHTARLKERFRWVEKNYGGEVVKNSEVLRTKWQQVHADSSISGMALALRQCFLE